MADKHVYCVLICEILPVILTQQYVTNLYIVLDFETDYNLPKHVRMLYEINACMLSVLIRCYVSGPLQAPRHQCVCYR